jgi:hypothetical protein
MQVKTKLLYMVTDNLSRLLNHEERAAPPEQILFNGFLTLTPMT